MFSTALQSKKHLQMGSTGCFILSHINFKSTYAFHQQHFHDAFKLCKILHEKKTAVENKS